VIDEPYGTFGYVHRVIAYALEVARNLDSADEKTQVTRHWLLQCEHSHCPLLDLDLEFIEQLVARNHFLSYVAVALEQRLDREVDETLGLSRTCRAVVASAARALRENAGSPASAFGAVIQTSQVMYASVRSSRGRVNMTSVGPLSTRRPR
jgi:hypothetical protein